MERIVSIEEILELRIAVASLAVIEGEKKCGQGRVGPDRDKLIGNDPKEIGITIAVSNPPEEIEKKLREH